MAEVKINDTLYPASVNGKMHDLEWDGRQSKTITLEMDYATAVETFIDGAEWYIIYQQKKETGEIVTVEEEQVGYSLAGDITDHRDGTISVKMGKLTDLEEVFELIYGGTDE